MKTVNFEKGVLTTNNDDVVLFLSYHPSNSGSKELLLLEKSLPRIDGLKRRKNRMLYALNLKNEMDKNGLTLNPKTNES